MEALVYNRSMSTLPLEEKRNKLILALYELHTTKGPRVDIYELEKLSGLERREFYDMIRQLGRTQKGWLIKSNERVSITPEGIEKAEELLKMQMVEKERLVLKKIYDLGGPTHMDWVPIDKLSKELGMPFRELNPILNDFERRGWVEGPDEALGLTPAGVREVENPGSDTRGGATTVQNIFQGPFQGGMIIGGHGHTQHNTFSNNPKVGEAIDAVMRLVQQSDLGTLDKEDVLKDVERLKELTSKEQTPDTLQRIEKRIGMVKDGIETAEKGGELITKVTPYLVMLWQALTS